MNGLPPFDDDRSDRGSSSPWNSGNYNGRDEESRIANFLRQMADEMEAAGNSSERERERAKPNGIQVAVQEFDERIDVVIELGEFERDRVSVTLPNPTTLTIRGTARTSTDELARAIELPEAVSMNAKTVVTNNKVMTVSLFKEDE